MSPRAAWRLRGLGYRRVFDYAGGKMDWLAHGLPSEGKARLVRDELRTDVVTCGALEACDDVRARLATSDLAIAVVVDAHGVVLGSVTPDALADGTTAAVERIMREGPTTVRPSEEVGELEHRMAHADVGHMIVTTPAGTLVGLYGRQPGANGQE